MEDGRRVAPRQSGVMPPQSKARVVPREVRTDGQFSARARLYRQNRGSLGQRALPARPDLRTFGFNWRLGWFLRATKGLIYLNKSRFGVRILLKNRLLPLKSASAKGGGGRRVAAPVQRPKFKVQS